MEFTYRLTMDDQVQFIRLDRLRAAARYPKMRLFLIVARAVIMGVMLPVTLMTMYLAAYVVATGDIGEWAFVAIELAFIWGLIVRHLMLRLARQRSQFQWLPAAMIGEFHLKVDSDGVEWTDQFRTSKYRWRAFTEVSDHAEGVVLWSVDEFNFGVFVPAGTLASEETRRELVRLAREQIALASAPAPSTPAESSPAESFPLAPA
jgi:hypothetical protein